MFLHELENVTACATGKAFINAQARVHVHGGASVIMEGADAQVAAISGTLQRYKIFNDQRNICMGLELLNNFVRVECHGSNLARKHRQNFDRNIKKESVLEETDSF